MDCQEDLVSRDITLTVLVPGGQETTVTVHGSKPVMDLLVTLCAQHHLAPTDHVIKLMSTNQNHINFKPNSMIGSLEFEKVILQSKGSDKRKPHVPVATVRLLVNYKKSHKTVVRVDPTVALSELMPVVCEKCEFDPHTTVLLRTSQSEEALDLSKSLNEHGIRELFAKDARGVDEEQKTAVKEKNHIEKRNKGFFGLFKKNKKPSEQGMEECTTMNGQATYKVNRLNGHTSSTTPGDLPKKRRAPQPPKVAVSQSASTCDLQNKDFAESLDSDHAGNQGPLSRISSAESSLKRTKRRAPAPPSEDLGTTNKVEEAEQDSQSSDKLGTNIPERCPAIAQVLNELAESLQARKHRVLSSTSNSSTSQTSLAETLQAHPTHHQLMKSSEREDLGTFTVVPQRCQETLTSQRQEQEINYANVPTTEIPATVFTCEGSAENMSEAKCLEMESQAVVSVKMENSGLDFENDQCIYPKVIKIKNLGPIFSRREMSYLEVPDSYSEPTYELDSNFSHVERWNTEELLLVNSKGEKIYPDEYQESRRECVGNDDDLNKVEVWGRIQREFKSTQQLIMVEEKEFPSPPPPVCWEEGKQPKQDIQTFDKCLQKVDDYRKCTIRNAICAPAEPETNCAGNYSITPKPEEISVFSDSHSSTDPSPPVKASLFALAVFQKVKGSKAGKDPGCSRTRLPVHMHCESADLTF